MATSDKPSIGRGLTKYFVYYDDYSYQEKSVMFYENLITELTTSFEENCCDYDNTQSTQSVENVIRDFLSSVNTFYDGERLSIIIGKRYPELMGKVYKIIGDCGLIPLTTESDGIKLYNRKTGRVLGY